MTRGLLLPVLAAGALSASGCQEATARPQLELFVDVDMPVPSQIDDDISADAVVDTIRIEVLGSDKTILDSRIFSLTSPEALPLSFGIPSDIVGDGKVVVRIRAFRALFGTPGQQADRPVLDPVADATVDRLVELELPSEGIKKQSVTLHGDCIGSRVGFAVGDLPNRTCIDADHIGALATDGIESEPPSKSIAGSWSVAHSTPCISSGPEGTHCIAGGFSILGDVLFTDSKNEGELPSVPLRAISVDPFFMDETEVTVGLLRDLIDSGYDGELPYPAADKPNCDWEDASDPDLPVNCISYAVADQVCAFRGGRLPTEAEWDYAARGRGDRFVFPWGSQIIDCCSASVSRIGMGSCFAGGLEKVGSHLGDDTCLGDISRDGIVDLTGGVVELVRDSISYFDEDCWAPESGKPAILHNPVCILAIGRVARGSSWGLTFGDSPVPIRRTFNEDDPKYGFRCVFEETP